MYKTHYNYSAPIEEAKKRRDKIKKDDILDIVIAVNTAKDVNEFLEQI